MSDEEEPGSDKVTASTTAFEGPSPGTVETYHDMIELVGEAPARPQ
jgi:hypothetical protein